MTLHGARVGWIPLNEDIRWVATSQRVHIMRDNWHIALCGMYWSNVVGVSMHDADIPKKPMCQHCERYLEEKGRVVTAYLEMIEDALGIADIERNRKARNSK